MFEEGDKHIEYLVSAIILLILIVGCFFVLRPFISARPAWGSFHPTDPYGNTAIMSGR
jgi:hypothetical protein